MQRRGTREYRPKVAWMQFASHRGSRALFASKQFRSWPPWHSSYTSLSEHSSLASRYSIVLGDFYSSSSFFSILCNLPLGTRAPIRFPVLMNLFPSILGPTSSSLILVPAASILDYFRIIVTQFLARIVICWEFYVLVAHCSGKESIRSCSLLRGEELGLGGTWKNAEPSLGCTLLGIALIYVSIYGILLEWFRTTLKAAMVITASLINISSISCLIGP